MEVYGLDAGYWLAGAVAVAAVKGTAYLSRHDRPAPWHWQTIMDVVAWPALAAMLVLVGVAFGFRYATSAEFRSRYHRERVRPPE